MPHRVILFLLLFGFVRCQAQAQVLPTVSPAPTAVAPPSQTPPPAATTLPATPRPVAALPIRRILFQPGDLPDGYRVVQVSREIDDFVRYKLRAADVPRNPAVGFDAFVHLGLQQTKPSGGLAAYFYDDPGKIRGLYLQLVEWASHDGRQRVPKPGIGDEATLFLPDYDQAPFTLVFRRCRASVQIDLRHTCQGRSHHSPVCTKDRAASRRSGLSRRVRPCRS